MYLIYLGKTSIVNSPKVFQKMKLSIYFFARYTYFIFKNIAIFVHEISFQHFGFEIFCIYITLFNCLIYE